MPYEGPERRVQRVCPIHDIMWETLQKELKRGEECMTDQQGRIEEFSATLQQHTLAIQSLEKTINNGFRSEIEKINVNLQRYVKCVQEKLDDHSSKIAVLDSFAWFRTWMTNVRDNMFISVIKLIFAIFVALILIQAANMGVADLVKFVRGLW